ncbi:MAG: para-aminobenzoate synthase, (PABA) [Bathelium mastoideum]|nr:MAG: para-aminobenzoate synthase, (PABA) [Bathelium mastoideum]
MAIAQTFQWLLKESGLPTVLHAGRDVHLLLLARLFRMFAYGSSTLILAIYFSALGHSDTKIGLFMTLTSIGDVFISLLLTNFADGLGRRRTLLLGAIMMAFSGLIFSTVSNYWILLIAAIFGVISPSGKEIGPFRAVEESTISHLTDFKARTDVLAWYVVVATLGTASGALACGWFTQRLMDLPGWTDVSAYRAVFWAYTLIGVIKAGLTLLLSPRCESNPVPPTSNDAVSEENEAFLTDQPQTPSTVESKPPPQKKKSSLAQISRESWGVLIRLCCLFAVDSLSSGMVSFSLTAFFMERKFHMSQGKLGTVLSIAQFCGTISNIFAAAIARRIGLIKTMVFTHLPSAIFLALIPIPSYLPLAVLFIFGRATLSSMDQAPKTAFLAAIVLPTERTAVMGVVNTVKTLANSGGPVVTGALAGHNYFWVAFVAAGVMKAAYDLGLLALFLNTKIREESESEQEAVNAVDSFELESDVESEGTDKDVEEN